MYSLIAEHSKNGHILPRPIVELYGQVRDFKVWEDRKGVLKGCGALEIVWEDLAEIRSLAVNPEHEGKGIGTELVKALMEEAEQMGVYRVFVLTYRINFFERQGFRHMEKSELPHKIWADCIKCAKFPECDETAMVRNT
jgi:amino-acid N-acetyltransferase